MKNRKYEYVDLGLSVMWASNNVGADFTEDYGEFYAWGEIKTKRDYSWFKYKFNKERFIHGLYLSKYNEVDEKRILDLEDDVAHVTWGGDWRMPTMEEFEELRKNCTWIWTEYNGVEGYKVVSNKKGFTDKYIFLPAAGSIDGKNWSGAYFGNYWTSSVNQRFNTQAYYLQFSIMGKLVDYGRCAGRTVRPVIPSQTWSVKFKEENLIIDTGRTYKLSLVDQDDDIVDYFKIIWSSDNPSVAKIDDYGRVTGVADGQAFITASINERIVRCAINVKTENTTKNKQYDYVNLGLSVMWARCNLGAKRPEEMGDFYAWGEINIKTDYSLEKYRYRKSGTDWFNVKFSKYNGEDNKLVLDSLDDVANIQLGGTWRLPTKAEWEELIEKCVWIYTSINGINGYKIQREYGYTDEFIFLPAAGYCVGPTHNDAGSYGDYWSGSIDEDDNSNAYDIGFDSGKIDVYGIGRYCGLSIRPVCP